MGALGRISYLSCGPGLARAGAAAVVGSALVFYAWEGPESERAVLRLGPAHGAAGTWAQLAWRSKSAAARLET